MSGTRAILDVEGPGDRSGSETLDRYLYQCKVAVLRWIRTIELDASSEVICEFVDDVTTLSGAELCFAQVKTRDRGSWSVAKMFGDGGGIDALVRSYNTAKRVGLEDVVSLELILEGPESSDSETRQFVEDPNSASTKVRQKLKTLGVAPDDLEDFLSRLVVTTQFYARQSIDAAGMRLLGVLVPGLPYATVESLWEKLVGHSIAAHVGASSFADPDHPLAFSRPIFRDEVPVVDDHVLRRSHLLAILPPVPSLADEQRAAIEAANGGASAMTNLEWKLRVAGANDQEVERAALRRSTTAVQLEQRMLLEGSEDRRLHELQDRVLEYAAGVVADVSGTIADPALAATPASSVIGRMLQQLPTLGYLDSDGVFGQDGQLIFGLLCELSDQCVFAWREA